MAAVHWAGHSTVCVGFVNGSFMYLDPVVGFVVGDVTVAGCGLVGCGCVVPTVPL